MSLSQSKFTSHTSTNFVCAFNRPYGRVVIADPSAACESWELRASGGCTPNREEGCPVYYIAVMPQFDPRNR